MILFALILITLPVHAQTPELITQPADVAPTTAPAVTEGEINYEVDHDEDPGTEEVEEPEEVKPLPAKGKRSKSSKNLKESASQGSRAEKKIAPMMKSETKSKYKKNGRALDVDAD